LNEIEARVDALASRVASLKDWKQKYEEDKRKWDEEDERKAKKIEELTKKADAVGKLREVLIEFLGPGAAYAKTQPIDVLNLEHRELVVNLTHEEKELNLTTGTVNGKLLFCALTELSKDGFSEAELSEALKEYGWNIPHNTLAPNLGGLAKDGTLIRLEGTRPTRYRLPQKVKLNIKREGKVSEQ